MSERPTVMTREAVRDLDRKAIEDYGLPGVVLMENAGRGAAEAIARRLSALGRSEAVILCGKGNNGGDGYVVARHLHNWGRCPTVFLCGKRDEIRGDARLNLDVLLKMGYRVQEIPDEVSLAAVAESMAESALLVDALLGTGLSGEVRGPMRELIEAMNRIDVPVVAIDIPSGLDANEGRVLGVCVRAVETVTFACAKQGFFRGDGPGHLGELTVVDIGVPRELIGTS